MHLPVSSQAADAASGRRGGSSSLISSSFLSTHYIIFLDMQDIRNENVSTESLWALALARSTAGYGAAIISSQLAFG